MLLMPRTPVTATLPTLFPKRIAQPQFHVGDRGRWIPSSTADFGGVTGLHYCLVTRHTWQWCYLIWLASDSLSRSWKMMDVAWEQELKLLSERACIPVALPGNRQ